MAVTFQVEALKDLIRDPALLTLMREHYLEASDDAVNFPPDPDWPRLIEHENRGGVVVWTARDGQQLVGYQVMFLDTDLITRTLTAFDGPYYLESEYREGQIGYKLMFGAYPLLRDRGVKRVVRHFPLTTYQTRGGLLPLFERAGHKAYEVRLGIKL